MYSTSIVVDMYFKNDVIILWLSNINLSCVCLTHINTYAINYTFYVGAPQSNEM